jgi:hypothetical protein
VIFPVPGFGGTPFIILPARTRSMIRFTFPPTTVTLPFWRVKGYLQLVTLNQEVEGPAGNAETKVVLRGEPSVTLERVMEIWPPSMMVSGWIWTPIPRTAEKRRGMASRTAAGRGEGDLAIPLMERRFFFNP